MSSKSWEQMTKEEQQQCISNMNRALTPRTQDGLICPVTFTDGSNLDLVYPAWKPRSDGLIRGAVFPEEFADGKVPKDLMYARGFQRESIPSNDPLYMGSIVYNNPVLNLHPAEQRLIMQYRQGSQIMQPMCQNQLPQMCEISDFGPNVEVVNRAAGGMVLNTAKGEVFLGDFSIEAVEHRLVHRSAKKGDIVDEYELCVKTRDRKQSIVVAPKDIDGIVGIIQRVMPMCSVSTSVKKAQALIVNHVRKQLSALPERHFIQTTGFMEIDGRWFFAHDGAAPIANLVFQTGYTIPVDANFNPKGAYRMLMEFLGISDRLPLMLPMVLLAHLSPMFNLFDAAGYVPRFVLFINGRTGSLKTSTAMVIFRIFAEQPTSPEANFKDTEVALEIKLGEGHGRVILLDDYRPPVTSVDGKSNLSKLESVIRAVGDRIAKSRSNPELGKAKEFLPTSCVVVTGEDLGGTQSSQLRMLIVSIGKGDICGSKLKHFQDNPLMLTTHMAYFLKWAGDRGADIIQFIKSSFELERQFFKDCLREPRIIDTAATLMLTARILHCYGVEVGAVAKGTEVQNLSEWRQAILEVCLSSEGISKAQDPVQMYLQAFLDMKDRKELDVAASIQHYEAEKHIGYADGDFLWLWHREVFARVVKYWSKLGIMFPLTVEKTNEHLDSAGLIRPCFEARGEGNKKLFVCKSSLPGRGRMLVLNEVLARRYLDNSTN